MLSSISLMIMMAMFIFVWQPLWSKGFEDFHEISEAISRLNQTAKPGFQVIPSMLEEMKKMNRSLAQIEASMHTMKSMDTTMTSMRASLQTLHSMDENIITMNHELEYMNRLIYRQMYQVIREVDQVGNRFSPIGMVPFNW